MDSQPKISVLMAVFDARADYLAQAVESVLQQSLEDFEFIIVDDGSNSATRAHLHALSQRDARIRLISLDENIGLTRALNVGLKHARGEYIARQDADDLSMPDRLEATIAFLEERRSLAAAGTFAYLIGNAGERDEAIVKPDLAQLKTRNVMVHGSMIFRRAALERVGGYNEKMRLSQDYELYLRMMQLHGMQLGVVPVPLYSLRQHANSLSSRRMFRQFYFSALAKSLTVRRRNILPGRLAFLGILTFDLLITHRMLVGPLLRKIGGAIRRGC